MNAICDDLRLLLFLKHQAGHSITLKFTQFAATFLMRITLFQVIQSRLNCCKVWISWVKFNCYFIPDMTARKTLWQMLCADELCIEEYVINRRFDICRHLIFVTWGYFNKRSNIERQRLELPKTDEDVDMVHLSVGKDIFFIHWGMHEDDWRGEAAQVIDQFKSQNIEKLKKYYPFIKSSILWVAMPLCWMRMRLLRPINLTS